MRLVRNRVKLIVWKPRPTERPISIKGIVDEERKFGSGKLLIVGDILVFCECSKNYIGLNVVVSGVIERFPEDLRVRAFSVKVIS